jgi:hypothetical protein
MKTVLVFVTALVSEAMLSFASTVHSQVPSSLSVLDPERGVASQYKNAVTSVLYKLDAVVMGIKSQYGSRQTPTTMKDFPQGSYLRFTTNTT